MQFIRNIPTMRIISYFCRRGLCSSAKKSEENLDFVQRLFLESVREYYKKLKENNGKLFDMPAELEKERESKIKLLTTVYAGEGVSEEEFIKFPSLTFEEPVIDDINLKEEKLGKSKIMSPPKKKK